MSMITPPIPLPAGVVLPSPSTLLTGLIVGWLVSILQYGISISQAYLYMFTSERDSRPMRLMVCVVFIFETLQTGFIVRAIIFYTVWSFSDPQQLLHIDWTVSIGLLLMVPIVTITQGFYIHRIHHLSRKSKVLFSIGSVLLVLRVGFHIAASVETFIHDQWIDLEEQLWARLFVDIANGFSAVIDCYLAATLVYFLYRSRSDFDQTDSVVRWIMAYTVNTGLLAMIISIVIVITFVTVRGNLIYAGLISIQSRLYSNSLLGALNARPSLRARLPTTVFEVNSSYEMSRLGIARCIPRFEVFQETLAIRTVDGHESHDVSLKDTPPTIPPMSDMDTLQGDIEKPKEV